MLAGADAVTLGNHAWDQREALVFIEREPRLVRPANYPPGTPGRGATLFETRAGARVLVVNVMGRLFMDPLDDPFAAVERELDACPLGRAADAIVVDVHAEATSEKQALGAIATAAPRLVVGTHTHVPDRRPPHPARRHGVPVATPACAATTIRVLGMKKDEPSRRFIQQDAGRALRSRRAGEATLCGVAVETDDAHRPRPPRRRRAARPALGERPRFWE